MNRVLFFIVFVVLLAAMVYGLAWLAWSIEELLEYAL